MKSILLIFLVSALVSVLNSHPASFVSVDFNFETMRLKIDYDHDVTDKRQHYISEVSVELNGKEIISQTLSVQDTNTKGSLIFKVAEAKAGDKITVITKCIKAGYKNGELVIKK